MHIAVLFEFPTLHGGERSLLAVIDELRRQGSGVEFTAIAPAAGPLAEALSDRKLPHIPWSVRDERRERRPAVEIDESLAGIIHRLQPDLVHANSLSMGRMLGRITPRLVCPATAHLRDILRLSAAAIGELNRLDRRIAVSSAAWQHHVAQGMDAARTVVIHNGVDLDEFVPRPATGSLHRELGLPRDKRLIAAIGQIGLRKGWDVLAAAAPPGESVHLLLIGVRWSEKEESRRYEAELRDRFVVGGWSNRVHWLGARTDVSRILNEIDLLAHPAKQEPLGRVLLEAMASGVPVVATDVGGTREIIDDGISGRLVPPGDAVSLAVAVQELLNNEPLSRQFRHAARQTATDRFDLASAASRHFNFWAGKISRENPAGILDQSPDCPLRSGEF